MCDDMDIVFTAAKLCRCKQADAVIYQPKRSDLCVATVLKIIKRTIIAWPVETNEHSLESSVCEISFESAMAPHNAFRIIAVAMYENCDVATVISGAVIRVSVAFSHDSIDP